MRIAINAAVLGKRHSGVGTYIIGLIGCLRNLGHEVVVYGSSPLIPNGTGVKVARASSWLAFDNGAVASILRFIWNQMVFPFRLRHDKIDCVVSQNVDGSLWCSPSQILVIHDLIPLFFPGETPRLRIYYNRILPLLLKRAAAILAVSDHTREAIIREYRVDPAKVWVAYNGLRPRLAEPIYDKRPEGLGFERYFLFVGTFAPRKNLTTVTKAFAEICDKTAESLVIVAYPDKWCDQYLRAVEDLGLRNRIQILSGLEDSELAYVYRHATALLLLSEYEGFGFPPLEAMLSGTAAVVSDGTALAEVVGGAAIKINAHDVEAAAETMLRLSRNLEYRRELQRNGTQRARSFTWIRAGTTINEILSQLALPRKRRFWADAVSRSLPL